MKLYTRRGDAGATDLFGGQRVDKDDSRIQAVGEVDELNSTVGLAASACSANDTRQTLVEIQSRLFEIGADLATPREAGGGADEQGKDEDASTATAGAVPRLAPESVTHVEGQIDAACQGVPAMKSFILPGGSELSARLHLARTVCRRAERVCITLQRRQPVNEAILIYLNRLSDLLFALARQANHRAHIEDVPWVTTPR